MTRLALADDGGSRSPAAWLARPQWIALLVVLAAVAALLARTTELRANIESDSPSYLEGQDHRPHGYFIFLRLLRFIDADLSFLPLIQLGMLLVTLGFFTAVAMRQLELGLPALLILPASTLGLPMLNYGSVMSDALFETCLIFSIGFAVLYFHSDRLGWLFASGLAAGWAIGTKTTGLALLPVLGVSLAFHLVAHGRSPREWLRAALIVAAPVGACMIAAAASNAVVNNEFRIGEWGGMSIVGKGLAVATPLPQSDPGSRFNWIAEEAAPVGRTLERLENPVLKTLTARTYYEYLRWFHFYELFDEKLPGWAQETAAGQGRMAGEIGWTFISNNPGAYAELALLDYMSLWLVPKALTRDETAALEAEYRSLGPLPFLAEFERTPPGQIGYFMVVAPAERTAKVIAIRVTNAAFLIASLVCAAGLLLGRSRRLFPSVPAVLLVFGTVHVSYVLTALSEAGVERYTIATWPLLVTGALMGAQLLGRWTGLLRG